MAKKSLSALSPSETEILRILWQLERGTVQDICDHLPANRNIVYTTVQTLLRRLEAKKYIKHESKGKAHVFFPVASRKDVISRTVGDFVDRLFGGDPLPLILHLAEDAKLSEAEVKRLQELIKKPNPKGRR
jgi:BlaI family penicillinase repressor